MAAPALPTSRAFITQLFDSLSSSSVRDPSIDETTTAAGHNTNANPLNNVPDVTKKQLLSLQVLFPNEFVPALDLLDRRLVTRFRIYDEARLAALKTAGESVNAEERPDTQMQDAETTAPLRDGEDGRREDTAAAHTTHPDVSNKLESNSPLHRERGNQDSEQEAVGAGVVCLDDADTIYYVRSVTQRPSRFATSYDTTICYQVRLQSWNCSCPAFAFAAFPAVDDEPPARLYNTLQQKEEEEQRQTPWTFGGITLGDDMPHVCKHLLACLLVEKCKPLFGVFAEEKNIDVEEAAGWAAGWGD